MVVLLVIRLNSSIIIRYTLRNELWFFSMDGNFSFKHVAQRSLLAVWSVKCREFTFFSRKAGLPQKSGVYSFWTDRDEELYLSAIRLDESFWSLEEKPTPFFEDGLPVFITQVLCFLFLDADLIYGELSPPKCIILFSECMGNVVCYQLPYLESVGNTNMFLQSGTSITIFLCDLMNHAICLPGIGKLGTKYSILAL